MALPSVVVQAENCYSAIDAQRDVFESHRHHIFSVAYYMTGDEREAETILQSTFIEAFRLRPKPSIEFLDHLLMEELHQRLSLASMPRFNAGGSAMNGRNVRRTDLEEALWQLPARERLCFLLCDVEGYSTERIAGLLNDVTAEVQRTLLSARLRLRALLAASQLAATQQPAEA